MSTTLSQDAAFDTAARAADRLLDGEPDLTVFSTWALAFVRGHPDPTPGTPHSTASSPPSTPTNGPGPNARNRGETTPPADPADGAPSPPRTAR